MAKTNRRRFLEITSASTLGVVGGCVAAPEGEARKHPVSETVTAWPSFRGDRTNTGYARGAPPTGSDPSIEWTVDTEGPVWGSPVVVDDTVYVGSSDRSVYAIDAETGEERWAFPTGHRVEATPAVAGGSAGRGGSADASDGGTVYVGSYDRHLYAIEAATGDRRWARDLGGLIRGSPTVREDAVFVGVGCHNLACAWYADEADASENGWVYSLDAASGETNWRYDVGDEVVSTPAVDGETVYVGASDGALYALDVETGDVAWTYAAEDMLWSSPALAYGTVYVGDWDGIVHAVDAASGEPVWTADTYGHYISGSVAVDETSVYVGDTPFNSGDDPGTNYAEVFAFDRADGEERWRFETPALEIGSSPVVTDDRLYVGTHRPTEGNGVGVHALSTDGEEEWFLEIDGRGVGSSPALVDGTLYFGGTDGRVYAVA